MQPPKVCCTISLFSGALLTGIDGLFGFFDKLRLLPVMSSSLIFLIGYQPLTWMRTSARFSLASSIA